MNTAIYEMLYNLRDFAKEFAQYFPSVCNDVIEDVRKENVRKKDFKKEDVEEETKKHLTKKYVKEPLDKTF